MKIKDYNQMIGYMTKKGTPEQIKKAEENNRKYLADRQAKTLSYHLILTAGLLTVLPMITSITFILSSSVGLVLKKHSILLGILSPADAQ